MARLIFLPLTKKDGTGEQSYPDNKPDHLIVRKTLDLSKNKERAKHGERNHGVIECGKGPRVATGCPLVPQEEAESGGNETQV